MVRDGEALAIAFSDGPNGSSDGIVCAVTSVIAHRGASVAARENTVEAFRLAVAMGADAIELDVRRTADGHLVVHHDAHLADATPIVGADRRDLPPHIPDLDAALDACAGAWVNVEIKNDPSEPDHDPDDEIADATTALLARRGEPTRWLVSSFRLQTVDRVHVLDPAIGTAWLVTRPPDGAVATVVERGHRALHPYVGCVTEALVRDCHAVGVAVNTWTCDDAGRMAELVAWGVDGICTNVPDLALAVRRGVAATASTSPAAPGTPA